MATATLKQDVLLPLAPGGNGSGAAMAVLVHAVLLAGLTLGVDWRSQPPEVVAAELWAAVPQSAAPPAPPPPPPSIQAPAPRPSPPAEKAPAPPAPDIALEQERKRAEDKKKADEKKADDERKERDKREKASKAEQAETERLARQREENLRRMLAQAGDNPATTGTGTAATNAAPSAAYAGRVKAAVRPNIVFTEHLATNNAAEVEVTAAPGGSIISRKLVKSSGSAEWDEAVLRAIDKTSKLPTDAGGRVPPSLLLVFRPNE